MKAAVTAPVRFDRRRWLVAAACLPTWHAAFARGPAPQRLIDVMPLFWAVYDAGAGLADAARAQALHQRFFAPQAALYARAGMEVPKPDAIARWLHSSFDADSAAVRRLHAGFGAAYRRHVAAFRRHLPDFDGRRSPVFLMPSLLHFDGHLQPSQGELPLFFGLDGIVHLHGGQPDLDVLLDHETYHCYQGQKSPAMMRDAAPLYLNLWVEGTATYCSELLNPRSSLRHVLLDDEALLRDGPAAAPRVAQAMLSSLDRSDDATLASFFTTGWHGKTWPTRAGYYVGLLVARQAGRAMSLQQMAAAPEDQVRGIVRGALSLVAQA